MPNRIYKPNASGLYRCPECGKKYKAPQALGIHRSLQHGVAGSSPTALRDRLLKNGVPTPESTDTVPTVKQKRRYRRRSKNIAVPSVPSDAAMVQMSTMINNHDEAVRILLNTAAMMQFAQLLITSPVQAGQVVNSVAKSIKK